MRSVLSDALALADRGFPVFPVRDDKRPACANGFLAASLDPDVITAMFAGGAPLIGIPTGRASGLTVVDIDPRNGGNAWLAEHGATLPRTRRVATRSGGAHLVFNYVPGSRNTASRIAPGVDTRSEGGYIVHWPAAGCPVLDDAPPADMPDWLIAACAARPSRHQQHSGSPAPRVTRPASPLWKRW